MYKRKCAMYRSSFRQSKTMLNRKRFSFFQFKSYWGAEAERVFKFLLIFFYWNTTVEISFC